MNKLILGITAAVVLCIAISSQTKGQAPITQQKSQQFEYASVRFMGKNTSFVWPDGKVEKLYSLLPSLKKPSDADDRVFHLTMAMNYAAQHGWQLAALGGSGGGAFQTTDDIYFQRSVK